MQVFTTIAQAAQDTLTTVNASLGLTGWALISAVTLLSSFFYLRAKYNALKPALKQVATCGYVAPRPSEKHVRSLKKISKRLTDIQVGEIFYEGLENIRSVTGPRIVACNHPHWADAAILPQIIDGPARFMAHGRVMTSGWGLLGLFLSRRGAFAANDDIRDGGARTREAAVQIIMGGETLGIAPEGLTNFSPVPDIFKAGTVRIAREVAKRTGKAVHIVPVYIRYGRYPGPWLSKFDRALQFKLVFIGFPLFRRKARVVAGTPISTDDLVDKSTGLPLSDEAASAYLREKVIALDPGKV